MTEEEIQAMQQALEEAQADVQRHLEAIGAREARIGELEGTLAEHQTTTASREDEIASLKEQMASAAAKYRALVLAGSPEIPQELVSGATIEEEFATLRQHYADYNFFFLHLKGTDSAGEDGDFKRKVAVLEQIDGFIPELKKLNPDVIVVAGDHSTPATLQGHSWHPVPVLLHSPWCRPDRVSQFSEPACTAGGLGRFPATHIMPLAMANALKLTKFGA